MSSVRRRAWGSILPAPTLLAGTLFAASASTARGTSLRDEGRTRITEPITAEQRRTHRERDDYQRLRRDVDRISRAAGRNDARVEQAQAAADRLAARSGFTELKGAAVRVSLDDAPSTKTGEPPHGTGPEYGLGYSVRTLDRATLPPYTGNVTMNHAAAPAEPGGSGP